MTNNISSGHCGKQNDTKELLPWWESPYIIYGFSNPRVRSRLERLMGTFIVRVTDRESMLKLQLRIREDHVETLRKRIHERELLEVEREKRLILEGKMAVEEAPEELSNHPVFKITQLARAIIEEKRKKEEEKKRPKKLKRFDYTLLEGREESNLEEDMEIYDCIDVDESDAERVNRLQEREEMFLDGEGFEEEDYFRIKYEDPLIEELREVETVDELYELADEIIGPLTGKPCGGRSKK